VSLLFYFGPLDQEFARKKEEKLERQFLPKAKALAISHDAHLLLDLVACPYLTKSFRRKCAETLLSSLRISVARHYSNLFLKEIEQFTWFVNWREIDLLSHLRKKELRAVY
jgi:hypothetical protein